MAEDTTTTTTPEEVKAPDEAVDKPEETEAQAPAADAKPAAKTARRKKAKRSVPKGQVHVLATFNNTIVTFTDDSGNVLTRCSAGACGFRGSKKGTAYAAQVAAERAANEAKQQYGFAKADIIVKGVGMGRDAAVRVLSGLGIGIESIRDVTGIPHGGTRPRKARRV